MPARPAFVTLTTDFGQQDHYVGQMKGAILRIAPSATIIDITHAIPPQNVRAASFLLDDVATGRFPPGAVHLAVIDPGVGSHRRILAAKVQDQFLVAPDNGLLTRVLDRCPEARLIHIPVEENPRVSNTFHGRDVMAPAAARLAMEGRLDDLGPPLVGSPVRLERIHPRILETDLYRAEAEIAWVDHFGNLITNVPADMLSDIDGASLTLTCRGRRVSELREYYSQVPAGRELLLIGSSGYLEVALNAGSAADRWAARPGDAIHLEWSSSPSGNG